MTTSQNKKDLMTFLLYFFGFLLLWEWVKPLEKLTDTGNIEVFVVYLGITILLSFLRVPIWLGTILNSIYIGIVLQKIYYSGPFFTFSWLPHFLKDIVKNSQALLKGDAQNLSNHYRSLLFFLFLAIMVYLLRYWLINKRQIFTYFLMTVIYITILDTFTTYSGHWAMVRTLLIGFAIMGILTFYRLMEKEGVKKKDFHAKKWLSTLAFMIAFSLIAGFIAPKLDPIWPDPVPFFQSMSQENDSSGSKKTGYGTDDSQLGGPLLDDHRLVFRAEVDSRHYWKVETKDVYTGKGWVASEEKPRLRTFSQKDVPPVSSFSEDVTKRQESSILTFSQSAPHIVYPAGLQGISTDSSVAFRVNPVTEKISSIQGNQQVQLNQYTLTYEIPEFSVTELTKTQYDSNVSNSRFMSRYTQLPNTLPPRIGELAEQITAENVTWFDQARAIEKYLGNPNFVYDKMNVLIPGEEDDYVDQFLFESQRGYCNNYSTSMVVMLRTLGIPSRWVKGYTEGEFRSLTDDGKRVFEITNNHAHSWVEVYFPNVGWVPFEPTKGFSNHVLLNFDTYKEEQNVSNPEPAPPVEKEKQPDKETKPSNEEKPRFSLEDLWRGMKEFVIQQLKWILIGIGILLGVSFLLYQKRAKWIPFLYIRKLSQSNKDEDFIKAYLLLLKQLKRLGLIRKEHQTLRDYAQYIDRYFSSKDMSMLTARYEEYLYKGTLSEGSWRALKGRWKKLINMTIA